MPDSLRATVSAGPAAHRRLLDDVRAGRVYRDANDVDWVVLTSNKASRDASKRRAVKAVVQALAAAGAIRLVGGVWEVCDVA